MRIFVVGIERLSSQHPDISIFVGAIDEVLSEDGMIVPGLGDSGDRLFGTAHDVIPVINGHEEDGAGASSPAKDTPSRSSKRKAGAV
jgi:hypothetical protein